MDKIYGILRKIVLEDSRISEVEGELLDSILFNLSEYQRVLSRAIADQIITPAEEKELVEQRERIFNLAHKKAMEDNYLADEESALLLGLINVLGQLKKIEDTFKN